MYCLKLALLIWGMLLASSVLALAGDREQPIQIEANQATINNIEGTATYQGNVIVTQGSIHITAETVIINYSKEQNITNVIARGDPVNFQQRLDQGDNIKAKAKEMEYNAAKDMLHLRQAAELRKERNGEDTYISQAPNITYDTQQGIISADKGDSKQGRIIMTLKPQAQSKSPPTP